MFACHCFLFHLASSCFIWFHLFLLACVLLCVVDFFQSHFRHDIFPDLIHFFLTTNGFIWFLCDTLCVFFPEKKGFRKKGLMFHNRSIHIFSILFIFQFHNISFIQEEDAFMLFHMLDASHEGHIQADEFLNGCLRLDGPAKAIDLAAFMEESRKAGRVRSFDVFGHDMDI